MNKKNLLYILLLSVAILNFFFPSELNFLLKLGVIYAIFLIFIANQIEAVYINKTIKITKVAFAVMLSVFMIFIITTITGVNISLSRDYLLLLFTYFMIFHFIRSITLTEKHVWRGFILLSFAATIIAIYAISQYATNFYDLALRVQSSTTITAEMKEAILLRLAQKRVFAFFSFPTTLAAFLSIMIPVNIGLLIKYKNSIARIFTSISTMLLLATLFLTKSYGGIITLGLTILMILLLINLQRRRVKFIHIVYFTGIMILLVSVVLLFGMNRGALLNLDDPTNPIKLRLSNWKVALDILSDYSLAGVGLGNYGTVFPQYYKPGMQPSQFAHNSYLQIASEVGLPGFLILFSLFLLWFFGIVNNFVKKPEVKTIEQSLTLLVLFASALSFLINNLFEINVYYPSIGILGIIMIGTLHKVSYQFKESEDDIIYNKPHESGKGKIILREKTATNTLILLWFLFTALICQRFIGHVYYNSAKDKHIQKQTMSAFEDLKMAKFADPLDSNYFHLESLLHVSAFQAIKNPYSLKLAADAAEHAIKLNRKTPFLHKNYSHILFLMGNYLQSMKEFNKANQLMPFIGKYKKELEDLHYRILTNGKD